MTHQVNHLELCSIIAGLRLLEAVRQGKLPLSAELANSIDDVATGGEDTAPLDAEAIDQLAIVLNTKKIEYVEAHVEEGCYHVDLPPHSTWNNSWIHVESFDSWSEALDFCKTRYGADEHGRVELISYQEEDGEEEDDFDRI